MQNNDTNAGSGVLDKFNDKIDEVEEGIKEGAADVKDKLEADKKVTEEDWDQLKENKVFGGDQQ